MAYYTNIIWKDKIPYNSFYNDIYFSNKGAIEEKYYVFITHNKLQEKFQQLKPNDIFIIAEAGFGAGITFLTTLKLWQETVKTNAKLIYFSFEELPLSPSNLNEILNTFPIIQTQKNELMNQYTLILPTNHRMHFNNNVILNLIIGDINKTLNSQLFNANVWFLDGFTPKNNPKMWTKDLINNIALHSLKGTSFSTYTANSLVKKNLIEYGFTVHKAQGFYKREIMYGELTNKNKTKEIQKPWFKRYQNNNPTKEIGIIGGGISAATTAYELANKGYKVTIYERHQELAMEASGNYQGILFGNFFGNYTPMLELSYAGYRYSYYLINKLLKINTEFDKCGLIQLATSINQIKQFHNFFKENLPQEFRQNIKETQNSIFKDLLHNNDIEGIYYPHGLWIDPKKFIYKLTDHPNITIKYNHNIVELYQLEDFMWQFKDANNNVYHAANLVICNSYEMQKFNELTNIKLRVIRGQISIVNQKNPLKTIICAKGYITPNKNHSFTIGASFKFNEFNQEIKQNEHIENLLNLKNILPNIIKSIDPTTLQGQAALRCSTLDYMPLVGPVAHHDKFKLQYAKLKKDKNYHIEYICPYLKGLYINVGHGAKGILTAPICATIISDYIDNTPFTTSNLVINALHPNRFWYNELIRND